MAKIIESYNAALPAAYYEIGTVYSFYAKATSKGDPASQEFISLYSGALHELEAQQKENAIKPVKNTSSNALIGENLRRYYAVVVDKDATSIKIMFLNDDNGKVSYLTRLYIVSRPCETDGLDLMPPAVKLSVPGITGGNEIYSGITVVQENKGNEIYSGITVVQENKDNEIYSGITVVQENKDN